jgi:hypothetical protein
MVIAPLNGVDFPVSVRLHIPLTPTTDPGEYARSAFAEIMLPLTLVEPTFILVIEKLTPESTEPSGKPTKIGPPLLLSDLVTTVGSGNGLIGKVCEKVTLLSFLSLAVTVILAPPLTAATLAT